MDVFQIVSVEDCPTTIYMAGQVCQQWAKTPAGCQPSGPGWNPPIVGETNEVWLWKRDFDPIERQPLVRDLARDTQPVYVDSFIPRVVIADL
jgi:hypothetical protein